MKDYLKELCVNAGVGLIYTDDYSAALSVDIKDGAPFIKATKVFTGCPERVAKAIIGYYVESKYKEDYLKVIRDYLHDNVVSIEYTIAPPNRTFKGLFIKHTENEASTKIKMPEAITPEVKAPKAKTTKARTSKSKTTKNLPKNDTSSLVEMNIASITKKSFYGEASSIKPDEPIKASRDDVVELEIQIDDSKL